MATVTTRATGTATRKALPVVGWVVVALVIIAAAVTALLLSGTGLGAREPATFVVSEQNANGNVALHVGDKLVVSLAGNLTTGYTWEVASTDAAILKPVDQAQFTPAATAVGSGGKVSLEFEAVGAGQTSVKLLYHRPFEAGVAPLKTFELTATVAK